MNDFMN